MTAVLVVLVSLALLVLLLAGGYRGRSWVVVGGALLIAWAEHDPWWFGWWVTAVAFASLVWVLGRPAARRELVAQPAMRAVGGALPRMSETERLALEAGTVWWDGELFSGAPRWGRLMDVETGALTDEERAFLAGPVEQLCAMIDDIDVVRRGDLTEETWAFIKEQGFLGMIIPKEYGGLGFGAFAHSQVIVKLTSRSLAASVSVMVPNSLGPGELLVRYGTDEQKRRHLPRLARGEEIPCFALTGPENGSDAAAMRASGVVCRGEYEGREVLGMRLNWNKRYTTLAPRATLIGLAFKLRDPDGLLGAEPDLGITCALVPAHLPGIEIGTRHDPLGVPFLNGPHEGHDVFVPLDAIIGGPEMAGQGWRMLMDCLAAGRSISLPSLAAGAAQVCTRVATAYTSVREQFKLPVARFEGVQERLARIGGFTYLMDAARRLTASAVDHGEQPAVLSAVVKAYLTEGMRVVVNDAMDVLGGAGLSRGPRNPIARLYQAVPIGITVEGANILTRSMIIYGQGAIRCHPYVQAEIDAVARADVDAFDVAFSAHVAHLVENGARASVAGFTRGRSLGAVLEGPLGGSARDLSHLSAAFATVSEAAMATLGGALKRREMLSGRLADVLAWMYLGSAVLKRYRDDGRPVQDESLARYAIRHALHEAERALFAAVENLPRRLVRWKLRVLLFPFGMRHRPPCDDLVAEVARHLLVNQTQRDRLTADAYRPPADEPGAGAIDEAFRLARAVAMPRERVVRAVREGRLAAEPIDDLFTRAADAGIVDADEAAALERAFVAREDVVQVDAYAGEAFADLAR